uniref:2,4-dienoyl-CoA reductase [(3E)-enoyl-CoA-producing] n=1 Tax=Quercus lobata TaxID=97700 RepID=A0A7N2MYH8_QUELO
MAMESPFKAEILKGKVALLTGGGSGIGYEISYQLGKHGASIVIMGRRRNVLDSAVDSLRSHGIHAVGLEGDVRKREDAIRVLESTIKHFGRLDILVNAAAGNFLVAAEDLTTNGFRTVIEIDSVGTFTMCHEALKNLKKGGPGKHPSNGGTIINISVTMHYTATWYQIHVSSAKAAVDSITRSLALEWGTDYDIRPSYKFGEKWDIAMAALYLASDAGTYQFPDIGILVVMDLFVTHNVGKYVNGTTLVVDGGQWLSSPRDLPKEAVKQLSRAVESRSRAVGVPKSKL